MQKNSQMRSKVEKWLPNGTPCEKNWQTTAILWGKNGNKMQKLVDVNYL
jgi:hypothetical protein